VTEPFDERKSYLAIKAHEGMIAFVSFLIKVTEKQDQKEGILKISSFDKPFGGGYLTLTFIVDIGDGAPLKDELNRCFQRLTERSLRQHMGLEFESLNRVSLNRIAHVSDWQIEEINIHFKAFRGEQKTIVEQYLLPALERLLPCSFHPVEWWPEDKVKRAASSERIEDSLFAFQFGCWRISFLIVLRILPRYFKFWKKTIQ